MAGRGAGGGPGKSDVHLGAVRGGGPWRSKHPPLRAAGGPGAAGGVSFHPEAAGGVSFHPETGSQHLAFHSRERVLRCIDQYTARQYRHQSGQKEALAFARTSSCTSKTEQDCKPGSVSNSHLSRRTVAGTLQPPRERPGQPWGSDPLLPYRCCSG